MKTEETPETISEKEISDRLRELELQVQYQEIEKQLARDEGRREGIKYVIEMVAVVLTILIGAGIFTLWNTTKNFQQNMLEDMRINVSARELELESTISAREIELEDSVETRVSKVITDVETRTYQQEITRAAAIATRVVRQQNTRTADLATRANKQVVELSDNVSTRTVVISDTVGALNQTIPTLVYEAVDRFSDPVALQAVAIEIVQTRADIAVQESFSQTVKQAVSATTDAMATATAEVTPTATP